MPMDEILLETEEKMDSALEYLREEFRGIRTGRASAGLVDHVKVDYYGSPTDLRQLASIAVQDGNQLLIKPFDPGSMKEIERAIQAANLGVTPMTDGKVIRISVPSLSVERREQIVTQLKKMAEACRVALRNARRDANKTIDREEKESLLTEDDAKVAKEQVQELINNYEKKVSELAEAKTEEIRES
jgi:ribosome recycling factor